MGLLIVDENGKILRTTIESDSKDSGLLPQPLKIAQKATALAKKARSVVRDLNPHNDLTLFRVRAKNKQEMLIAPDKNLFLLSSREQTSMKSDFGLAYRNISLYYSLKK